jgi:phosphoglycolate phosphatase
MTAKALIFDLDGTLAETAPDLIAALNVVLAREGIDPVPLEAARGLVGAGARALIQRGFAHSGEPLAEDRLEDLFVDFLAYYNAHIAVHSHLFPGVEAQLDKFGGEGWRLAICTNKIEASAHLLLQALGVARRFDFVCGQDTFGVAKPNPHPLLETIRAIGATPATSVMVGDSDTDIRTARAAGTPVVAVDFGYTDIPVTELGPDRVISHFDGLYDAVRGLDAASLRAAALASYTGRSPQISS